MGMGGGGDGEVMADINVTPLVDVMLVLLIIFMVTAPLLTQGVEIDLPDEVAEPLPQEKDEQLILGIDKELNYYIGENKFTAGEMPVKLEAIAKANPDQVVYLRADGEVPYAEVAFLLAAAKRAGMPRIGLVFEMDMEEDK
ncbi:MAG: ExbD/TolR family protein [Deltaproteobacteria bacterium]|nr:ExbD/TolR family protein [Deltaproteobacteria bacterium]